MSIKVKISLIISLFFSLLFGGICAFIVNDFSEYRKEEFEERLNEKAVSSIKLLVEVQGGDNNLLKIIDQNSINKLYSEKTLIFDSKYNLIYSSVDDTKINWNVEDLKQLKSTKTFFKKDGENEIYGFFYDSNTVDYFALISANDSPGKRKLNYLISLILISGIIFIIITWVVTFYIIKKQLLPLNIFQKKIAEINVMDMQTPVNYKVNSKNEIDLLGKEFNAMIVRIGDAYQKQKEFTANASHELKTPLARISAQIENQLSISNVTEKLFLKNILNDVDRLNDLINSLLILSKIDTLTNTSKEKIRIEEVIYNSIEKISAEFLDCKVTFNFNEIENLEELLEIDCNQNLLEIVFQNLIKNAYIYSDNKKIEIDILEINKKIAVKISNNGKTLSENEQLKLFQPFMRGQNAKQIKGLGLGLKMVQRILTVYGYKITYQISKNLNVFLIEF
jgi:signal transduction histidine kinase